MITKDDNVLAADGFGYHDDMRAIVYVRVSTEKQADFGVSPDAQTGKIRAMTLVRGRPGRNRRRRRRVR